MPIITEIYSVIVRRDSIGKRYPGGWSAFLKDAPAQIVYDAHLACVRFMDSSDARAFVTRLENRGLTPPVNGEAVDLVVVGQTDGPWTPCAWLGRGRIPLQGGLVMICWAHDKEDDQDYMTTVCAPEGWKYEGSFSQKTNHVKRSQEGDRMKFLRREGNLDVYLDLLSGKETYVGRPKITGGGEYSSHLEAEAIIHECRELDAKMQAARSQRNKTMAVTIHDRLANHLFPAVRALTEGDGKDMAISHFAMGIVFRVLTMHKEAELCFRKANDLSPDNINVLLELVRCLGEQGRPEEAIPFARQGVKAAPVDPAAWGNLAICLLQSGQREEAKAALDEALTLDPKNSINCNIRDHFDRLCKKSTPSP